MPEDSYFPVMLSSSGVHCRNEACAVYKSKQFQIVDTKRPEEKGMTSRKQVRKECSSCAVKERMTLEQHHVPSPLLQGASLLQQIEIAKLHQAVHSMLDNDYVTSLANIQSKIDTRMAFAKM